jgi:hypothetical protein
MRAAAGDVTRRTRPLPRAAVLRSLESGDTERKVKSA